MKRRLVPLSARGAYNHCNAPYQTQLLLVIHSISSGVSGQVALAALLALIALVIYHLTIHTRDPPHLYLNVNFWILVSMLTFLHLNQLYCIMFLFLHLVCLHDNDDAVKNNPITVLFNHEHDEGIAIIETMAPMLYSETVKC